MSSSSVVPIQVTSKLLIYLHSYIILAYSIFISIKIHIRIFLISKNITCFHYAFQKNDQTNIYYAHFYYNIFYAALSTQFRFH